MVRAPRRRIALCALILLAAAAVRAQEQTPPQTPKPAQTDVALALVLAVDASGSVSNGRFELQKQGYAAAFRSRQVLNSIRSLATQSIAVTMMQWTGPQLHVQVVDWKLVKDEDSASALADAIEASQRQLFGGGTSISGAIDYSRILLTAEFRISARGVSSIYRVTAPTIVAGQPVWRATRRCTTASASTACQFFRWNPISTVTTTTMSSAGPALS